MHHHAERRGGPTGETTDESVGSERSGGRSWSLALPIEHRPLYRRQARDQRPG